MIQKNHDIFPLCVIEINIDIKCGIIMYNLQWQVFKDPVIRFNPDPDAPQN